jgi:DUF2937 family protein
MLFRAVVFVCALIAALTASQLPEFAQQYRQRLGGAIDELARILTHFDEDAARSGYDRAGALRVMSEDAEQLVRDQAARKQEEIKRYGRLVDQQQAFTKSGPFGRLVAFFADFDEPLVENTMRDYEPAVPTTLEGIVFACSGFVFGYLLLHGARWSFRGLRRRRRRARHYRHINADGDELVFPRRGALPARDTDDRTD